MNTMNPRNVSVISYITWIGWFVALVIRDPQDPLSRQHINQSLMIHILKTFGGILAAMPLFGHALGGVVSLAVLVFWVMGLYRAVHWRSDPLPLVGELQLV